MHIPAGTLIDIQPFGYSLNCSSRQPPYSFDLIRSEGFVGGTENVRSANSCHSCKLAPTFGTWEKSTSNQYIMRIEFQSDKFQGHCTENKYGFKIQLSHLRRKKATIGLQDNCISRL